MFKHIFIALVIINHILAIPLGLQQLKGNFQFSNTCPAVKVLDILSNECARSHSKKFAVSFSYCKKRYFGTLQDDFKITQNPCQFDESKLKFTDTDFCEDKSHLVMEITGFFNDIYDYVYIGYIAISQSLIAAYYIINTIQS